MKFLICYITFLENIIINVLDKMRGENLEFILEFFLSCIVEGLFFSSEGQRSKKIKIWHGIFRSSMYLAISILFLFLSYSSGSTTVQKIFFLVISLFSFYMMIKTNFTSYKRHVEWAKNQGQKDQEKPF